VRYDGTSRPLCAQDAKTVLVGCGPGMNELERAAGDVGVIRIRVLRPWSAARFLAALPASATRVVVVDPAPAFAQADQLGPLFRDVSMSLQDAPSGRVVPVLVPIRVRPATGAGVTESMAQAVLELGAAAGGEGGIVDQNSMPTASARHAGSAAAGKDADDARSSRTALLWSVSATPASVQEAVASVGNVLASNLGMQLQVDVAVDVGAMQAVTRVHARYGQSPFKLPLVLAAEKADYVGCHDTSLLYLGQYDLLKDVKPGGTLLLNCPWSPSELSSELTDSAKHVIAQREIQLYTIDAEGLCDAAGLSDAGVPILLSAAFLHRSGGIVPKWATDALKKSLQDTALSAPELAAFGALLDNLGNHLQRVEYSPEWAKADYTPASTASKTSFMPPALALSGAVPKEAVMVASHKKFLAHLFGSRLVLADASDTSSLFGESFTAAGQDIDTVFADRAEYCFGVYLARLHHRQQLIHMVGKLVANGEASLPEGAREVLSTWLATKDDAAKGIQAARSAQNLVASSVASHPSLAAVHELRTHFTKQSKWIIGGNDWACDIGYSGIHHIMASGENVNVLILETTSYDSPSVAARSAGRTKKDIGLYVRVSMFHIFACFVFFRYSCVFMCGYICMFAAFAACCCLLVAASFGGAC